MKKFSCCVFYANIMKSLQALENQPEVTGTYGKVFICGDARIGKTTLRKTLLEQVSQQVSIPCTRTRPQKRHHWILSCYNNAMETEPESEAPFWNERPTRGIEIHHMRFASQSPGGQEIELAVWDMAGQSEYEVLHSAFLPDLALADGQATFFIVVCSANNREYDARDAAGEKDNNEETARASLVYWLRFIASNSSDVIRASLRRKVLVVLNCFNGKQTGHGRKRWADFLNSCQREFQHLLVLQTEPFIVDAQNSAEVSSLKEYLARKASEVLQQRKVPHVCDSFLDSCRDWLSDGKNQEYPVVSWKTFSNDIVEYPLPLDVMKAATIYLHEAGHLVLFRELKKSGSTSAESDFERKAVVVLHPHWLCHKVMGHLLLPEQLLEDGEEGLVSKYLNADGSLPLALVNKELFQIRPEHLEETLQILVRLQLCYLHPSDSERVFIPALIRDDDLPGSFLEAHEEFNRNIASIWVMGFSVAPEDPIKNLLRVGVLRKLQVELAYDEDIGRKPDCSFKAGISRISFTWKGMAFLVEFQRDPKQAKYNRLDILVQPLTSIPATDRRSQRQRQVHWAHQLVERTRDAALICCPNVRLKRLIIKPWECSAGLITLEDRDVGYSVDEMVLDLRGSIKNSLGGREHARYTNWKIGGHSAQFEDLLPEDDWSRVVRNSGERCEREKFALDKLGVMNFEDSEKFKELREPDETDEPGSDGDTKSWFRMQFRMLHDQIDVGLNGLHERHDRHDREFQGLEDMLGDVIRFQVSLYKRVQSLETFTVEEQRSSVPRFPYLTAEPRAGSAWLNIQDAVKDVFSRKVFLHFLCESGFGDSKIHEVKGQEGISMRDRKDWVKRLAPALNWSLKIALWAMKISGQVILPRLGLLMPEIPNDLVSSEATMISAILDVLTVCSETVGQTTGGIADASPAKETEVRQEARGVLKKLLDELTPTNFERNVGLKKVLIQDSEGHTQQVVWICHSCFTRYGPRAKPL